MLSRAAALAALAICVESVTFTARTCQHSIWNMRVASIQAHYTVCHGGAGMEHRTWTAPTCLGSTNERKMRHSSSRDTQRLFALSNVTLDMLFSERANVAKPLSRTVNAQQRYKFQRSVKQQQQPLLRGMQIVFSTSSCCSCNRHVLTSKCDHRWRVGYILMQLQSKYILSGFHD